MTTYELENRYMASLISRYPVLKYSKQAIIDAYKTLIKCFSNHNKLLIAGNGGSAADAEHIVGELMKGFIKKRELPKEIKEQLISINSELGIELSHNLQCALPAIALTGHIALSSAFNNDCNPEMTFAQQVLGYGKPGDILLCISTSGNSKNILYAATTAKAIGLKVIGLTGGQECFLDKISDVCIKAPETETYKVQELHLPIYHCLCLMLEERFFHIE